MVLLPEVKVFNGIPTQRELDSYRDVFFGSVEKNTYDVYSKEKATIENAVQVFNWHGNWWAYDCLPDVYKSASELGYSYETKFTALQGNIYGDFLHASNHIRSKSKPTALDETLLLPDQYYTVALSYSYFIQDNKGLKLSEINSPVHSPLKTSDANKFFLGPPSWLQDLPKENREYAIANFSKRKFRPESWILEASSEIPKYMNHPEYGFYFLNQATKLGSMGGSARVSDNFFMHPQNDFEHKLSENCIRAVFMDEKFIFCGSSQLPFRDTKVNTSAAESAQLIFSTPEENSWIQRIHDEMLTRGRPGVNQVMIDKRNNSHAEQIAVKTADKLLQYYIR